MAPGSAGKDKDKGRIRVGGTSPFVLAEHAYERARGSTSLTGLVVGLCILLTTFAGCVAATSARALSVLSPFSFPQQRRLYCKEERECRGSAAEHVFPGCGGGRSTVAERGRAASGWPREERVQQPFRPLRPHCSRARTWRDYKLVEPASSSRRSSSSSISSGEIWCGPVEMR